jgi:hypothetical protein
MVVPAKKGTSTKIQFAKKGTSTKIRFRSGAPWINVIALLSDKESNWSGLNWSSHGKGCSCWWRRLGVGKRWSWCDGTTWRKTSQRIGERLLEFRVFLSLQVGFTRICLSFTVLQLSEKSLHHTAEALGHAVVGAQRSCQPRVRDQLRTLGMRRSMLVGKEVE